MGEDRPSEVHGGNGECSVANAEEESDNDTQDVLGAIIEGAEVVGSEGLSGFPVPQRHVVVVDRVMEEEDLGGSGHDMSWVLIKFNIIKFSLQYFNLITNLY